LYQIFVEYRVILATLCVGLIGAFTAIYVHRRNAFRSAALSFRNAFIEELSALESVTNKRKIARDILIKSYDKHKIAVEEFRRHLGYFRKRRFDAIWKEHHMSREYDDVRDKFGIPEKDHIYLQYLWPNAESEEDATKLAIANIRSLLRYAKP